MKRTFLKFLPIAAAVLLATSCSKDNDGDNSVVNNPDPVETQNVASSTESNAVPFSIKVVTGNSLSKIGYTDADNDGNGKKEVTPAFTTDDVSNGLTMTISNGTTPLGTLTLKNADGTFEGTLDPEPTDGTELTATIKYSESSTTTTSTTSIADLMENCAHTYSGEFKYKTDNTVMLTDNNAYIEIIMSSLQHDIDLTIGGTPQNFAMANGKVWIAVANGTTFTTNFTAEKTCTAGKITTIDRAGFVDLGIEGILWADRNLGATEVYDYGNYYAWGEVAIKDDYSWDSYSYGRAKVEGETHAMVNKYCPTDKTNYWDGDGSPDGITTLEASDDAATAANTKWKMPEQSDFAALNTNCYWVWVTDYNSSVKGYVVYKKKSGDSPSYSVADDTHIFLPAAGYHLGTPLYSDGSNGHYWSSSLRTDGPHYGFALYFTSGFVNPGSSINYRNYGFSVRPVRCK